MFGFGSFKEAVLVSHTSSGKHSSGKQTLGFHVWHYAGYSKKSFPFSYINSVNVSVLISCISAFFSCYTGHFWSVCISLLCSTVRKEIFLWSSLITYSKFRLGPDNSDKSRKSFEDYFWNVFSHEGAVRTGSPIQPKEPSRQPSPAPPAWRRAQLLELLRQHGQNVQNNDDTCCLPMPERAHWRKGSCTDSRGFKA